MKTLVVTLSAVLSLTAATTSAALITPISQSRRISASASGYFEDLRGELIDESDSDSDSTPDFGHFSSSVSARAGAGKATASQTSNIVDDQITGFGEVDASGQPGNYYAGCGRASSSLNVAFQISQAVSYSIEGQLRGPSFPLEGIASFRLTGPDDNDVLFLRAADADKALSTSGTLTSGDYVLEAQVGTDTCFVSGGGSFDFDFNVVPEPASRLLFALGLSLLFAVCRSRN